MDQSQRQQLFEWGLCQSCMVVSQSWDPASTTAGPCPNCGEDSFGVEWPPEPARLLLSQAFSILGQVEMEATSVAEPAYSDSFTDATRPGALGEYSLPELFGHSADYEGRKDGRLLEEHERGAIRGFLVATALDVTLEWIVRAAGEALDADSLEAARFAEPSQEAALTTDQRLTLLYQISGIKLNEVAEAHDEPRFPGWWHALRSKRDAFLHTHSMGAFDDISEESLLEIARQGVKVLAGLNNAVL